MRLEVKQRSSSPGPLTRMKKSHCLGCKPIYMNSVMQIEVLEGICQRAKASGSARVVCNMATVTSLPFHQHFYETWWYTVYKHRLCCTCTCLNFHSSIATEQNHLGPRSRGAFHSHVSVTKSNFNWISFRILILELAMPSQPSGSKSPVPRIFVAYSGVL